MTIDAFDHQMFLLKIKIPQKKFLLHSVGSPHFAKNAFSDAFPSLWHYLSILIKAKNFIIGSHCERSEAISFNHATQEIASLHPPGRIPLAMTGL